MQRKSKQNYWNKEAHKLISNFNMWLQKTQEKELCKTSWMIKSRGHTTWVPCLELEGAFSPRTGGLLITWSIRTTSPFLFFGGPCETSTSSLSQWDNKFAIPPTTQIPFFNSSAVCFSSLSALLKPARSSLPSQKHTCYRVSPSQHRFTKPDLSYSSLDILMPFLFTISLKFPHSSLSPFLPFLHKLFFRISFSLIFSCLRTS